MEKAEMKVTRFDARDVIATSVKNKVVMFGAQIVQEGEYYLTGVNDFTQNNISLINWKNEDVANTYLNDRYIFTKGEFNLLNGYQLNEADHDGIKQNYDGIYTLSGSTFTKQ